MSKKVVIVGDGAGQLAAAVAHVMLQNPEMMITVVDTGEITDGKILDVDATGENLFYDAKLIDSLANNMSDRELYGITQFDALALINDRKLGDYRIRRSPTEMVVDVNVQEEQWAK